MSKVTFNYVDSLNDIIERVADITSFQYIILESAARILFEFFNYDKTKKRIVLNGGETTPEVWDKVRIFGAEAECRWHKAESHHDKSYHIFLLTDKDTILGALKDFFPNENTKEISKYDPIDIYLWGESTNDKPDEWYEGQIPRFLSYPLKVSDPKKIYRCRLIIYSYVMRDLDQEGRLIEHKFYRPVKLYEGEGR